MVSQEKITEARANIEQSIKGFSYAEIESLLSSLIQDSKHASLFNP